MTSPRDSSGPVEWEDTSPTGMARFRGALMAVLPLDHPVQDPTRAFTYEELEAFEEEFMRRFG